MDTEQGDGEAEVRPRGMSSSFPESDTLFNYLELSFQVRDEVRRRADAYVSGV